MSQDTDTATTDLDEIPTGSEATALVLGSVFSQFLLPKIFLVGLRRQVKQGEKAAKSMCNVWPRRPPQTEEDTVYGAKGSSISRGFSLPKEMMKQNLWRM